MAILEQASVLTDAIRPVPAKELEQRLEKFRKLMDARHPDWEMAVISHKVAMYYFTGTMQEGALIITPADAVLWVRRNFVRASNESHFSDIRPMRSFREAAAFYPHVPQGIYVETKKTTLDWMKLFHKHFPFETVLPLDDVLQDLRPLRFGSVGAVEGALTVDFAENSGSQAVVEERVVETQGSVLELLHEDDDAVRGGKRSLARDA